MKNLLWICGVVLALSTSGCGPNKPPTVELTPELEQQIKAHDDAVDSAERANQ